MAETLTQALFAVVSANPQLTKDARANYGEYATLGNVMAVLRPLLTKEELLVEQAPNVFDGRDVLTTTIIHVPTDTARVYHTPLVLDKDTMQGVGSAITYARRYALVSIFFLDADEDDDGNSAAGDRAASVVVARKKAAAKPKAAAKDARVA